jgi:hypothetical protein
VTDTTDFPNDREMLALIGGTRTDRDLRLLRESMQYFVATREAAARADAEQSVGDALMRHVTELTEFVDHGPDGLGQDDTWRAGVAFAMNRIVADLFLRGHLVLADPEEVSNVGLRAP